MARGSEGQAETRVLRWPQVKRLVGLSKSTVWRMERGGSFPRRRQLAVRAVGWDASEIEKWMETRKKGALAQPQELHRGG